METESFSSVEAGGVKAKLAMYQKECIKKKEFRNPHRPQVVGALEESKTDLSTYEHAELRGKSVLTDDVNKLDERQTDVAQYEHADIKVRQSTVPADMVNRSSTIHYQESHHAKKNHPRRRRGGCHL